MVVLKEVGFVDKDLVIELNGLRPTDRTRPAGDVVVVMNNEDVWVWAAPHYRRGTPACTTNYCNMVQYQYMRIYAIVPGKHILYRAAHDMESDKRIKRIWARNTRFPGFLVVITFYYLLFCCGGWG